MNLEVEGRAAYAYSAGRKHEIGRPFIVFVHGAGLDHSTFALQSRYYAFHGWNVLAFDLPGHGRSAGAPLASVGEMAQWICKAVAAEKFALVGHSMGALVALECAARAPARVQRIALLGVAYPMKVGEAFLDAAKRDHYDAFDMHTIWGNAPRVPLGANPNPGMWMYGDTQARLERLAPGALYADLKACNDYVLEGEVSCPALFILGRQDVMTPLRSATSLAERLPHRKTVVLDGSGHGLMAEAPDATLDALIDFFRT